MTLQLRIDSNLGTSYYLNRDRIHDDYFNEIRKYPILNEEEEFELIDKIKNGKTESERERAKNRLVKCNQRFVVAIVKRVGTPSTFLDLVNEGNIGLIKAIEKFDPTRGYRFITYAVSWILASIKEYQLTQVNMVVPPNAAKVNNYVKNVSRKFYNENEREPTPEEIMDLVKKEFNFNITSVEDVELGHTISIEEKYNSMMDDDDKFENSILYTSKTGSNNINDAIEKNDINKQLDFFLGKLTKRERFVVEKKCGIGCLEEGFDTIAMRLNLTYERIRQIYVGAIKKMNEIAK